jgi:biopolymer transport protein ExbB
MERFFALLLAAGSLHAETAPPSQLVDLKKVFAAAPVIYTVLMLLSVAALAIWLYSLATLRPKDLVPQTFLSQVRPLLAARQFEEARKLCETRGKILGSIIAAGLTTRQLGAPVMMDAMKSEGKRAASTCWQRLSLLNDIVIVAPMLGLLGTVIGMFYAFYDVNRSIESINALFDGLGVSVGTTVVGLVVSIVAMILYTTLKYRMVRSLTLVENEALALSPLIDSK